MFVVIIFVSDSVQCGEASDTGDEWDEQYARYVPLVAGFTLFYSLGVPALFYYLVANFKHHGKMGDKIVEDALGWSVELLFHSLC